MATIFSKIISGEIPAYVVAENNKYLAFLDINPLVEGHTLVIPKKEVDYIFDLDDEVLSGLILFSKEVAKQIKRAIPCERIGVSVIGLEVPHAHIHLVPMFQMSDMNFANSKKKFTKEQLASTALQIKNA